MPYKDPEKKKANSLRYYAENRGAIGAKNAARYTKNRPAILAKKREYAQKNKDVLKERHKAWYESGGKDWAKEYALRRRYNLTLQDITEMLSVQNGVCAICQQPNSDQRDFHVDHDHVTGKVRGLLCHGCNTALGGFKDDPAILARAIHYLGG